MRRLRHVSRAALIVIALSTPAAPGGNERAGAAAGRPPAIGIGVLGDSYSDEYRFYPPDRPTARNWVEILSAARGLNFGEFSAEGRGEPRNQGFAYNWARSDATTFDLIATGQHTGLAAQVARGEVGCVVVFIGGNDFIHALQSGHPVETLNRILPGALANFREAVSTLRAADPRVKLVLLTVPDIRHLPEFAGPIREGRIVPDVADAFTAAINTYNAEIRATAREPAVRWSTSTGPCGSPTCSARTTSRGRPQASTAGIPATR
ncbi:MAG: GDSL-type esterase/lipase family protein [Isosphaeraceae bacterium]